MDIAIPNKEERRKLELERFFDSQGWNIFEAEIGIQVAHYKLIVEKLKDNPIAVDKLSELNFNNGIISGLNKILLVKNQLVEEAISPVSDEALNYLGEVLE